MRAQDDWHFEEIGQGAFRFKATNAGGGLVVALTGANMDDINGYFIVLDDDNHETYVMQLASLGSNRLIGNTIGGKMLGRNRSYKRVPGVSVDPNFRLSPDSPQMFHVMYQQGKIVVGLGPEPGKNQIIHMAAQPNRPRTLGQDLNHYAFARLGSRWPHAIRITDVVTLKNVRSGRVQPMPGNALSEAKPVSNRVEPGRVLYQGGRLSEAVEIGGRQNKGGVNWGVQYQSEYNTEPRVPSMVPVTKRMRDRK